MPNSYQHEDGSFVHPVTAEHHIEAWRFIRQPKLPVTNREMRVLHRILSRKGVGNVENNAGFDSGPDNNHGEILGEG